MHKLKHLRESYGLSVKDLSVLSDISVAAISRIESGCSPYKTNNGVALALASALDVEVSVIFEKVELSHLGRPPHTGRPIASLELVTTSHVECPGCHLTVPRSIGCEDCEWKVA